MSYLFADDTKLFARVPEGAQTLQEDLDRLQLWSDMWQLRFNAEKCKVMHIGKNEVHSDYKMDSKGNRISLENIKLEKDLGVHVDDELKFKEHILIQVEKANKLLGLLRRGFTMLDSYSMSTLYKAIIRPHLEYGNVVWHPRYKGDEEQLESVQRRMSKLIPDLKNLDYVQRLKSLKLPSLYYRRARGDMIECFKYMSDIYNVPGDLLPRADSTNTRGHSLKLKKPSVKTSVRENFFSIRIVNAWNSLPDDVVTAPSLNAFKGRLDKVWSQYKYELSSKWFKSPQRSAYKNQSIDKCENNEEDVTSTEDNNRLIGD